MATLCYYRDAAYYADATFIHTYMQAYNGCLTKLPVQDLKVTLNIMILAHTHLQGMQKSFLFFFPQLRLNQPHAILIFGRSFSRPFFSPRV